MHNHIKKYEFRRRPGSLRLILWAPLERGGATVVAVKTIQGNPTVADLVGSSAIQAALPTKLKGGSL